MSHIFHVACITVFMSTMGCALDEGDEAALVPVEEIEGNEAEMRKALNGASGITENVVVIGNSDVETTDAPAFVDACSLPGSVKVSFNPTMGYDAIDEGVTAAMDLPFQFKLYGKSHSKFWITTNGQLGFGSTVGGSAFGQVSCPLADNRFKTPIVLVYSADLIGRMDGDAGVCFATRGIAPRRKLVVTWKDSFYYDAWLTSHVTFSATLHEATNVMDVAVAQNDVPTLPTLEDGNTNALGRQAGGTAQAYACHQPIAPAGTLVRFNP